MKKQILAFLKIQLGKYKTFFSKRFGLLKEAYMEVYTKRQGDDAR